MAAQPHPKRDKAPVLLLVGGGHAHVAVLADWIRRGPPPGVRTVLLTLHATLRYSGMVPGWIAGEYGQEEGTVDLAALARRAGVELALGRCAAIDPQARAVRTQSGGLLAYDILSLDTGGEGRAAALLGDDPRLVDVRPIDAFVDRMAAMRGLRHVVVAGGGAGGVELAFALRSGAAAAAPAVTLVAGSAGLLPGFPPAVCRKVAKALARRSIALRIADARISGGAIMAGETSLEPADLIVAALGSAAPGWVKDSGLAVCTSGFVAVDAQHRSISHPEVFAAGDVAARVDRVLPHSGVHAVFAGPVLAANLRAAIAGQPPPTRYRPRFNSLYLINTGDGSAIASYGPFAAEGRWVRKAKHAIDKRWIDKYASLGAEQGT